METGGGLPQLALRDYWQTLFRRKLAVLVTAAVAVALAVGMTALQPTKYSATAELLLRLRTTESLFSNGSSPTPDPLRSLQTEIRVLESPPVKALVEKQLGKVPDVTGTPISQTDVVAVRVVSPTARLAAAAANAYAAAYVDHRRTQAVDDLFQAGQKIQDKLQELQDKIAAAPPEQRPSLEQNRAFFESERDKLQLAAQLTAGGAEVVRQASVPRGPFSPTPIRNAAVALVLGLILGVAIAFLVEYADDSVKDKEQLERVSPGLPVLGLIPALPAWKDREQAHVVSVTEPDSPAAEAYRTLRTAVQFLGVERPARTIQVTSADAGEGKTTTIANLAIALARTGQEVVAICCDLRRPRLHEFFGLTNETGLTSVLMGECAINAAIQPVPGVDRLAVLASGPRPPNPSELLSWARTADLLKALKSEGRFVLIDSPPVLPVTDALVIGRYVDTTLLVCSAGTTNRKNLARAVELLRQVNSPVMGTVLNGVDAKDGYGDGRYYRTYGAAGHTGEVAAGANGHRAGLFRTGRAGKG